jgi:hypothetical protein
MNPQYYVRAAPRQPGPQTTFNAFTIRTAPGEIFDRAHLILIAETVKPSRGASDKETNASDQATASRRAVATIREIMQHEIALPVVRRLVEALRQTNLVLHTERQGVSLITGLLIKNTLYLACVGNTSAYLIRHNEVKLLLRAERTRDRYLGHARQFWLDYQLQSASNFFADQTLPHAYLQSERFVLAPGDTLVLSSTEVTLEQIKPTLIYARQPEKLANALAKITARQPTGQAAGVIALHWKVNRTSSVVQQLLLVLVLFFCMTFAMQAVSQINGKLDAWMVASGAVSATRQPAPMIYWATTPPESSLPTSLATDTAASQSTVKVNVNVNVTVDATAEGAVEAVALAISPTPELIAETTLPWPTDTPVPTLLPTVIEPTSAPTLEPPSKIATMTPTPLPTALGVVQSTPTSVVMGRDAKSPTPMVRPTLPSIIVPTMPPTDTPLPPTAIPTATPFPTATLIPAVLEAVDTDSRADETLLPSPTAPTVSLPAITILAPADQTSSATQMTFVWQSDQALPPGHAYELIVWQEGQPPLRDGLGIAAPLQEQSLTVQLAGLYATGVIHPGLYHWGVLLVTVDPYTRVDLLAGGQTVRFETTNSSSACDPDRQNC